MDIEQIFESKKIDPTVHRECFLKLVNLFASYFPTYKRMEFMANLSPASFGRFPSCILWKWLQISPDEFSEHVIKLAKQLNNANSGLTTEHVLINLLQVKKTEDALVSLDEDSNSTNVFDDFNLTTQLQKLKHKTTEPELHEILSQLTDAEDLPLNKRTRSQKSGGNKRKRSIRDEDFIFTDEEFEDVGEDNKDEMVDSDSEENDDDLDDDKSKSTRDTKRKRLRKNN